MSRVYNTSKVLDCIQEIYDLSKNPSVFPISRVCKKHNLSSHISKVVVAHGIVKIVNSKRPYKYQWNSVEPNMKMANAVIKETSKLSRKYIALRLEKEQNERLKSSQELDLNVDDVPNQPIESKGMIDITQFDIVEKGLVENLKKVVSELSFEIKELHQDKERLNKIISDNADQFTETLQLHEQVTHLESKLEKVGKEWTEKREKFESDIETYKEMIADFKKANPKYDKWIPGLGWGKTVSPFFEKECKNCGAFYDSNHVSSEYCSDSCRYEFNNQKKKTKKEPQSAPVNSKEFSLLWGLIKVKK